MHVDVQYSILYFSYVHCAACSNQFAAAVADWCWRYKAGRASTMNSIDPLANNKISAAQN